MYMRHLHYGQQRHQEKTNHCRRLQSTWPATVQSADLRLQSCQLTTPATRIHNLGCASADSGFDLAGNLVE
jgi:hypothetical protein